MKRAPKWADEQARAVIEYARELGGTIHRVEQSYWGPEELDDSNVTSVFPHRVIESLVKNGVMQFTNHVTIGRREIPIEAQLVQGAA